jgi:hypothetical protein
MEKLRQNAVVQVGWDDAREVITLNVVGSGKPPIVCDLHRASMAMLKRLRAYGAEVRITRAAALRFDEKTNKPSSPGEKYDRVKRMAEHIASGSEDWNPPSGDRIGADESLLARALAEVYPSMDHAKIRADVAGMRPEQRRALLTNANGKHPEIAAAAQRIRAADVADVDTDVLLEGYA